MYAQRMTELAIPIALFLVTLTACVRVLRAFPRLRVRDRRARTWTLLLALLVLPAAPFTLAARSYDVLGAGVIPGLILTGATLFVAMGLASVYVAGRADPSRGRVRCPRCWYDLSAAVSPLCPECGRNSTARQRARTRRSPRLALLGLLCIAIATFGSKATDVRDHGWEALIPTTLLILWLEDAPDRFINSPVQSFVPATTVFIPRTPRPPQPPRPAPDRCRPDT
jgi:hypothetical protein